MTLYYMTLHTIIVSFLIYELVSHDNVLEYDTMLCYNIASCDIESSDIVLYEFVLVYNKIQCFYFILTTS